MNGAGGPGADGVIVVSARGDGDYTTIAAALAAAVDGDEIRVRPGTYDESVIIDKQVALVGDGPVADIIVRSGAAQVIAWSAESGVIRGLTIRLGDDEEGAAIRVTDGEPMIADCRIEMAAGCAISVVGPGAPTIVRNDIGGEGGGLVYEAGAGGTASGNRLLGLKSACVVLKTGARPTIRGNRIEGGRANAVIAKSDAGGVIEDNEIVGNQMVQVAIMAGANPILRNNRILDGQSHGVAIVDGGRGIVEGNTIVGHSSSQIAIKDAGSFAEIRDNRIADGSAMGVIVLEGAGALIERNRIAGHVKQEVGVETLGDVRVLRNRIRSVGAAVHVQGDGTPLFADNDITRGLEDDEPGALSAPIGSEATPIAIMVQGHGHPRFTGNTIAGFNTAVLCTDHVDLEFVGNTICDGGDALSFTGDSRADIRGNTFERQSNVQILVAESATVDIADNEVVDGDFGVCLQKNARATLRRNRFVRQKHTQIAVSDSSVVEIVDNEFVSGDNGVALTGRARGVVHANRLAGHAQVQMLLSGEATADIADNEFDGAGVAALQVSERASAVANANRIRHCRGETQIGVTNVASLRLSGNAITDGVSGITVLSTGAVVIEGNTFKRHEGAAIVAGRPGSGDADDVASAGATEPLDRRPFANAAEWPIQIQGNVIVDTRGTAQVLVRNGERATIRGNRIRLGTTGIRVEGGALAVVDHNRIGGHADGQVTVSDARALVTRNRFAGGRVGVAVLGGSAILEDNQYAGHALASIGAGGSVDVVAGREQSRLARSAVVLGGSARATIAASSFQHTGPGRVVVCQDSDLALTDTRIDGGDIGVACFASDGHRHAVSFAGCVFSDSATQMYVGGHITGEVRRCEFHGGNVGMGMIESSEVLVDACQFANHGRVHIGVSGSSVLTLQHSRLTFAPIGILLMEHGGGVFRDNMLAGHDNADIGIDSDTFPSILTPHGVVLSLRDQEVVRWGSPGYGAPLAPPPEVEKKGLFRRRG